MTFVPKDRRPRLGLYCPGNGTGGPWRYVHSLIAGLDDTEYNVTLFCDLPGQYDSRPGVEVVRLDGAGGFPEEAPEPAGSGRKSPRRRLTRLAPSALRVWAGFGWETRRLAGLIRRHPVDLFHTQNTGCEESPVAARLAGVRRVLGTFHVDPTYDLHRERSGPAHRVLEAVSNRCLDAAIAVSNATKREWVRRTHVPPARVLTVHNGINPDRFRRQLPRAEARRRLGLPDTGLLVGGIGRLDEAKGFEYLLAAIAILQPEFPGLTVALAGIGPSREGLERRAAELGIVDRVRFLGFQTDVQVCLDALDAFAFPSVCETLGYALLEAMATELPAVGAAVGGIPEVIVPGETGFVVPPRDPDGLAQRLRMLLKDADLRTRMGVAGRNRVINQFHERDMVRRTIELYCRVLK